MFLRKCSELREARGAGSRSCRSHVGFEVGDILLDKIRKPVKDQDSLQAQPDGELFRGVVLASRRESVTSGKLMRG